MFIIFLMTVCVSDDENVEIPEECLQERIEDELDDLIGFMEDALVLDESYIQHPIPGSETATATAITTEATSATASNAAAIGLIKNNVTTDAQRRRSKDSIDGKSTRRSGKGSIKRESGSRGSGGGGGGRGGGIEGRNGKGALSSPSSDSKQRTSLEEAPLPMPDAFGPAMRETKIRNLKQKWS